MRDPIGMRCRQLPSLGVLRECLLLDDTGTLFWKERPLAHFLSVGYQKMWNERFAGGRADTVKGDGYRVVCINAVRYPAHRVIFLMATGEDPGNSQLDHINCDPSDNRPANLRIATRTQNTVNFRGPRADNKHGGRGVKIDGTRGKWLAWIMLGGKAKRIGSFDDHAEAVRVAAAARKALYGEFFA